MKYVSKDQSVRFQNSKTCTAIEYPLGDSVINGAVIELTGRYPDSGRVVNRRCKELAFVMSGSGSVCVEGKLVVLCEGDLVLIEPNERFFWEGKMVLFMPCTPSWHPEQYEAVE